MEEMQYFIAIEAEKAAAEIAAEVEKRAAYAHTLSRVCQGPKLLMALTLAKKRKYY